MSHDKEWVCAPSADCDIWKSTEYFETKEAAIEAGKKSYLSGTKETLIQKSKTYSVIGSRKM